MTQPTTSRPDAHLPGAADQHGGASPGRFALWLAKLKHVKGAIVAVAGLGAVLSGLVGWYTTYKTVSTVAAPTTASTAAPADAVNPLSILVLPFSNQTGDANKAYIADAMTSALGADLVRIRDAFVFPAATSFKYKDKPLTPQQIGREVGVRFVLGGAVLSSGEKIRISAQLADTQSGAQLWSETFEGELGNLFALQDQVTARIGNSIGREMVIAAARNSERGKSNPRAADLMLRARALAIRGTSMQNSREIEALYRQVLALEPGNAKAMAALATNLMIRASNFNAVLPQDQQDKLYEEGHALAQKSRDIDPDNPIIYTAQALYAGHKGDYPGMLRAAQTRASLEPKNPGALINLADTFINGGDPAQALEALDKALALEPRHPSGSLLINMAIAHLMARDFDGAIAWGNRCMDADPGIGPEALLAMAYAMKGDDARAQQFAALVRKDPNFKVLDLLRPIPSAPLASHQLFDQLLLPAARKAGLTN